MLNDEFVYLDCFVTNVKNDCTEIFSISIRSRLLYVRK